MYFSYDKNKIIKRSISISKQKSNLASNLMSLMEEWNPGKNITKQQVEKDLYMEAIYFNGDIHNYTAYFHTSYFSGHSAEIRMWKGKKIMGLIG